jgi:hypothetical protein
VTTCTAAAGFDANNFPEGVVFDVKVLLSATRWVGRIACLEFSAIVSVSLFCMRRSRAGQSSPVQWL